MGIAAPVIVAEMDDWTALGGGNSGICGDANHTYGFHLDALSVGPDDYSRWRDPNGSDGPYVDWSYCCAGDFYHGGNEALRAKHRDVLARLMRGELPMIAEFIGQPWADRPVYYWARWNGVTTLKLYTGAGHNLWTHTSWFRSTVDQRAHLWTPSTTSTQEDDMALFDLLRTPSGVINACSHVPRSDGRRTVVPLSERNPDGGKVWMWRTTGVVFAEAGIELNDTARFAVTAVDDWDALLPVNLDTVRAIVKEELAKGAGVDVDQLAAGLAPKLAPLLPKPLTFDETVQAANKAEDS